MQINITQLRHVDVWEFSHSQAENGFTGNAGKVTRRCNSRELAKEIIEDCISQIY